jgi:hypothetical protein
MPWYSLANGEKMETMFWYLTTLSKKGKQIGSGWMMAANDMELVEHARMMGYSIDIQFLGQADMRSTFPKLLDATVPQPVTGLAS